jgi:hypothetical protein
VSDVLAMVLRQLADANEKADRRSAVLARVAELESQKEELDWLAAYEADEDRYKVRSQIARACWPPWRPTKIDTRCSVR